MTAALLSTFFIFCLIAHLAVRTWLSLRQIHAVQVHRNAVPQVFAASVSLPNHQKAADYTSARVRLGIGESLFDAVVLLGFTLGGGVAWLDQSLSAFVSSAVWRGTALVISVMLISGALAIPFDLYRTFKLEAHFGFNRSTPLLWLKDLLKNTLLGMTIGIPLLALVLWLMASAGSTWWLWVWLVWTGFQLLMMMLYPTVIAPIFNRFAPLDNAALRTRIEALLTRCGFTSQGLFVMDGSKRSAHGNAYFTGFGKSKRIVFFDTLLTRLDFDEIEAVLAHELGHFKHKHVTKRLIWMSVAFLGFFALLGYLANTSWFYAGLGVPNIAPPNFGVALTLFILALPPLLFFASPLLSYYSRKHEFEADAYAVAQSGSAALVSALVKLFEDNATTLTPDALHSVFYDSHPPAAIRVGRLQTLTRP